MYAIVDIETTGGYAAGNDITEVAIIVHDGEKVVDRYETLVRPVSPIPYYIQVLTGISHEMVATAPRFEEVASEIMDRLRDRIFVAHNVNFDYSFLKHHLAQCGFELTSRKLCTVRLAKSTFPGLRSYSLGNICRHFEIPVTNRHRAGGDADATAILFDRILQHEGLVHIARALKKCSKEQSLPPNLPKAQVDALPYTPGVYYFHDERGRIIYVGKAKNLKYRVCSHFTHNGSGRQRQEFLRHIHSISFESCSTELMAFILENIEIRRLWPKYNQSQKRVTAAFGIYEYVDQNGYVRLMVDKHRRGLKPMYTFNLLLEGHRLLRDLVRTFCLCPKLCFIDRSTIEADTSAHCSCEGACSGSLPAERYNEQVGKAIDHLQNLLPSFAVVDEGLTHEDNSIILVERGRFYGMGYLPSGTSIHSAESLKDYLKPYPENDYIRGLIYQYVSKRPEKKVEFRAL